LGAPRAESGGADPGVGAVMGLAADARAAGRYADAVSLYRQALQRNRYYLPALRALRDLAVESGRWQDALEPERRLLALVPAAERPREAEWLATIYYELGRERMAAGAPRDAVGHFRDAVRSDRRFVPATIALGDAFAAAGDQREALRVWERAAEATPALPILARLERAYREAGRPTRMIALYQAAIERAPDDLALAVALGRGGAHVAGPMRRVRPMEHLATVGARASGVGRPVQTPWPSGRSRPRPGGRRGLAVSSAAGGVRARPCGVGARSPGARSAVRGG